MAHQLDKNTMAYAYGSEVPWHGLGVTVDPDAGALEWMKAAGLDWRVERGPIHGTLPNGEQRTIDGKRGGEYGFIYRDHGTGEFDADDVFGLAGPEWIQVQNQEVFEFMDRFCKAGGMKMETCGAIKGGTEVWALAKFTDDAEVTKGDPLKGHLLFLSRHIWGAGNLAKLVATRVVCANTVAAALGEHGEQFRMPHKFVFDQEVQDRAAEALGLSTMLHGEYLKKAKFLASKKVASDDVLAEFMMRVYQPKDYISRIAENDQTPVIDQLTNSSADAMEAVFASPGSDLKGAKGTWWGALNGVTYRENHMRNSPTDPSNILSSTWFGSGAARMEKAMDLAMEYAEAA